MVLLRPTVKRDLSLFSVKAWERGYIYYLRQSLKWPYPIIFYYDGEKVNFYHKLKDFDHFKQKITTKLIKNDNLFYKLDRDFKENIVKLRQLEDCFNSSDLGVVADLISEIMSFYVFIVSDSFLKSRPQARQAREISEGILYEMDKLIESYLKKLLNNKKIDKDLAHFLTPKEAEILMADDKLDFKKIAKRKTSYIIYNQRIITGMDFIRFCQTRRLIVPEEIFSSSCDQIEGQSSFSGQGGKIRGRVIIVNNKEDLKKISEGSILVTAMTNANYANAIKKSKAIVTDEGGILCHAAIISRELKIPCVTGTKIATKVFFNGQLVEVDANKGIVKIIK